MPRRVPRFVPWLAVVLLAIVAVAAFRVWSGGDRLAADAFADRPTDAVVVDVRTTPEFEAGHVEGAFHVNLFDDFESRMAAFDRERPVYLYCGTGARSGRAASILRRMGFRHVVNAGGFGDLAAAGAPTASGAAQP